jgi:kynurenine formamidase
VLAILAAGSAGAAQERIVDLTHSFDEKTIYWPTARGFALERVAHGINERGFWYAANNFCAAEHGGTHMDAPIHFAAERATADQVPVSRLIGPACVIDIASQCAADPDYRLTVADILAWEKADGRLPVGAVVLVHTGWGTRWGDPQRVFGSDTPSDTRTLHFPGFSVEAARFLTEEREIDAVGLDTPSLDHGPSADFGAHQVFARADVPGFENVANLDRLPATGATFIGLPMKIAGGSGGPARIVALLP